MIDVDVHVRHTLEVAWSVEEALALISDVPLSASHFPGLQRLDALHAGQRTEYGAAQRHAPHSGLQRHIPVLRMHRAHPQHWRVSEAEGAARRLALLEVPDDGPRPVRVELDALAALELLPQRLVHVGDLAK